MQSPARSRVANKAIKTSTRAPKARWEASRLLFGVLYLLGGIVHIAFGLFAPTIYEEFANQALLGVYTDLWASMVVPNLWFLHPFIVIFEIGLGIALLWRGPVVRIGHAAGAVFQAGLVLSGPWGVLNAVFAVIHLGALRISHPRTIFSWFETFRK